MGIVAEEMMESGGGVQVGAGPSSASVSGSRAWAERRMYPLEEAAAFLGFKSVRSVKRLVKGGEVEGFLLSRRVLVVSGQSLNRFLAKRRV